MPLPTAVDPAMVTWVGQIEAALTLAANISRDLEEIRPEFADCDFSRAVEFNDRYYLAREQLKDAIGSFRGPRGVAAELTALLLIALDLEIQADSIRSTSMQLALAEGRTSNCDAGDENSKDLDALEAKRNFVDLWNNVAPAYGGGKWQPSDF